jgi:hypothetical protein
VLVPNRNFPFYYELYRSFPVHDRSVRKSSLDLGHDFNSEEMARGWLFTSFNPDPKTIFGIGHSPSSCYLISVYVAAQQGQFYCGL